MRGELVGTQPELTLFGKIWQINWVLIVLLTAVASVGFAMLYSAANGSFEPWASRQMVRFAVGVGVLLVAGLIDIRIWMKLAYPIYGVGFVLLIAVELVGEIGMGAQRWIDLGVIQLQPSEVMKIAIVLVLARYFHGASMEQVARPTYLVPPTLMVLMPVALVLKQPDLGTAMMLLMVGGSLFFLAGVRLWKFAVVAGLGAGSVPIGWQFLHDYQKNRVLTFLDPETDPLGTGYHIMQSKIALGSGGLTGRGYLMGTQSHLNFLPEKHTDFIFTMLAEEFGLAGGVGLLGLYLLLLAYGTALSLRCRNQFGRLVGLGIMTNLFLYVFINMAMVMGLVPVVGVPLPLISYGGTSMMTILFGFGLLMSAHVHHDMRISRRGVSLDD